MQCTQHSLAPQGRLEGMVKVRLMLACLMLSKADKAECAEELQQLGELARRDDDEWVRIMGAAVADFNGQLDLEAVMGDSTLVSKPRAQDGCRACASAPAALWSSMRRSLWRDESTSVVLSPAVSAVLPMASSPKHATDRASKPTL